MSEEDCAKICMTRSSEIIGVGSCMSTHVLTVLNVGPVRHHEEVNMMRT